MREKLYFSTKIQFEAMWNKKTSIITYFIILAFVIFNFVCNVERNTDLAYVTQMYDMVKTSLLSDWSVSGYFFMQFFPLLVVFPTATTLLEDKRSGINTYIISRVGKKNYYYGKLLSVFLTTFTIFFIPLIVELLLNIFSFSLASTGDPSNFNFLQTLEEITLYSFSDIYCSNRILYNLIYILMLCLTAGIFAVFNVACTSSNFFKLKLFCYFPIFTVLFLLEFASQLQICSFTLYYPHILRMFEITTYKNYKIYFSILIVLTILSILLINKKIKKEEL